MSAHAETGESFAVIHEAADIIGDILAKIIGVLTMGITAVFGDDS